MKFKIQTSSQNRRQQAGFTLVEILVVIAIIAILAAAFLVAGGSAINAAKRAKANVTATSLQTAIYNFQTEYGTYPVPTGTAAQDQIYSLANASTTEGPLMIALCGNINASTATATTSTVPNTRQLAYLTPKKSDVDTNGIFVTPFSTGTTYYYYGIAMDADYDGILGDSNSAAPPNFAGWTTGTLYSALSPQTANLTQGAAIWACCDPTNLAAPTSSKTPALWVRTY